MRIAFICRENSCRSQIAEALAKIIIPDIEFMSAGTNPGREVDTVAIKVLKEMGIDWNGYPKNISEIDKPDIIVTMGCGVECPGIPGVKVVEWNIPDPKGKDIGAYHQVVELIKEKLLELKRSLEW